MAKREREGPMDDSGPLTCEIICQGRHAGGFIGRNGNSIENLRKESGASVKVSHFDQVDADGKKNDRLVQVSGTPRQVRDAVRGVAFRFAEISADNVQFSRKQRENEDGQPEPPENDEWNKFHLTILVPGVCVGRIVGSKGRKIKELSEEHGCKVNLSRDFFPPRPSHRRTQLQHHDLDGLVDTAVKICEIVQKTDQRGYQSMNGPYGPIPPPMSSTGYITTSHPHMGHYNYPPPPPPPQGNTKMPYRANPNAYPQSPAPEYPYNYYASHPTHAGHPYSQPPPPPGNPTAGNPPMNYGAAPGYPTNQKYPPSYHHDYAAHGAHPTHAQYHKGFAPY